MTDRLCLKACCPEDADFLFERYAGNSDVSEFLQRNAHANIEQTENFIAEWGIGGWFSGDGKYAWSFFKEGVSGAFGLFMININNNRAEIHYGISREMWGKGYTTEAGVGVMEWIRNSSCVNYVFTICDVEHVASLRVLEKLGLQKTQLLRERLFLPLKNCESRDAYLCEWKREDH
ncbi:MAG: GNAT family N-acetyltransferase [Micavibrio sp.]